MLDGAKNAPPHMKSWTPTRVAGLERLHAFAPYMGRAYANTRNADLGPDDRSNVSALSPWVRHRLITEEEILKVALEKHSFSASEKFVQELLWRTYFKGWLERRPQAWTRYQADLQMDLQRLEKNAGLRTAYDDAISGATGIEGFDDWASELVETGYLHNHARMWFASIWIFTLRLPWTLGADFFLRHLLDGDPASNTLSWRWVAGLHTRGKTYQARASNIRKYTNDRFFPEYKLAPDAPALEEPELGPAGDAPGGDLSAPTEDFLLLITEDDGDPATLPGLGQPRGVLAIGATAGRSPLPVGEIATSFAEGVLEDAQTRAEQHFGVEGAVKTDDDPWAETIISAAKDCGASSVVTGFIPVGPAHDRLAEAKPHLASVGIPVHQLMRPIDAATWPYASKGFFNVKKKIPSILTTLGLT